MNPDPAPQPAAVRAATSGVSTGELQWVIAERDSARTWFVVRAHDEIVRHHEQIGLTMAPGSRVTVEARSLRPVGVVAADEPVPSAIGFNPYFDLPPA